MQTFADISEALHLAAPDACEALELAAWSESLGLTDSRTQALGYADVFALAEHIFDAEYKGVVAPLLPVAAPAGGLLVEMRHLCRKLIVGLSYSLPWVLLTLFEVINPHALDVAPSVGSALNLAIIASLVTTGGLLQVITRDVTFFTALREPYLARRFALLLFRYQLFVAVGTVAVCFLCTAYFHLFSLHDFLLGAGSYVMLCLLWMSCATLSAQNYGGLIPVILLGTGALLFGPFMRRELGGELLPLAWAFVAAILALLCSALRSAAVCRRCSQRAASVAPRHALHFYTLLPSAVYGTVYFSFLFMDRFCAGSAVPWSSGLTFGIDPTYKHGMDIALFAFLLTATIVEYVSDLYMRRWWTAIEQGRHAQVPSLTSSLRRRYVLFGLLIAAVFGALMLTACTYLPHVLQLSMTSTLRQILWFGGLGYLLLATTLFGNIVLLSVDAVREVSKAAAFGCLANFFVGYTLAHFLGMHMATVGLLVGACVFALITHRNAWRVLASPDFYYSRV